MTERLGDISEHISGIRQLGAVVNAMRGIAAARAQLARNQLVAVDSYTSTIAVAMGRGIALVPAAIAAPDRQRSAGKKPMTALVLFCAEQGFAGAFSERVLDSVGADLAICDLFVIGTRGTAVIAQREIVARWTAAMPAHSPGIVKLADTIVEALYARIASGKIKQLDVVFAQWQPAQPMQIQRRRLFPLDITAFPKPEDSAPPLLYLTPAALLHDLTASYLHAELCQAALHGFSAENETRMQSMAAARNQIDCQLASLQATERQVRQEEITAEIIELAAGETASRSE